jgi:hypothetical protein
MDVWADPYLNRITVWWEDPSGKVISRTEAYLPGLGSAKVLQGSHSDGESSTVSVSEDKVSTNMSLCRTLQRDAFRGNKTS